ncbi:2900_t:CDS:1 [Entrophospora sp. SA101]|nr:13844_t:CDS:1 [Entrophospora sp. SA101]CAJ0648546.1 616_t:CDS:1 [Entrophospora sp. SA101]CAJ0746480.1 20801_t:CDS:1 [Entrophospora sp. SA101]CAJ0747934.1 10163_t:CDS:1 [Entrophospora sp. SA101]CAJ0769453.1 2900_t:CDS:1 [Entrophospora sp. SA101]
MASRQQQSQEDDNQQFQLIPDPNQVLQPIHNYDQQQHSLQQFQPTNHEATFIGQHNPNDSNNNNLLQQQTLYVTQYPTTSSATIYNGDHFNSSNFINNNNNDNDPLSLRISRRMMMIKDCIMEMQQQYILLEQDFVKLRRGG